MTRWKLLARKNNISNEFTAIVDVFGEWEYAKPRTFGRLDGVVVCKELGVK